MKRRLSYLIFVTLVMAVVGTMQTGWADGTSWEQVSDKNGIKVERRKPSDSPLYEFRATAEVDATPARLLALFEQSQLAEKWMAGVKSMKILSQGSSDPSSMQDVYVHSFFSSFFLKWQAVLRMKTTVETDQIVIRFDSQNQHDALKSSSIDPLKSLRGQWIFKPTSSNKTMVVYQAHSDPGGHIPDVLINWASSKLPKETLEGLRKQLGKVGDQFAGRERQITQLADYQKLMAKFSSPGSG